MITIECPNCKGKGGSYIHIPCPACHDTGRQYEPVGRFDDSPVGRWTRIMMTFESLNHPKDCACEGRGSRYYEPCTMCDDTYKIHLDVETILNAAIETINKKLLRVLHIDRYAGTSFKIDTLEDNLFNARCNGCSHKTIRKLKRKIAARKELDKRLIAKRKLRLFLIKPKDAILRDQMHVLNNLYVQAENGMVGDTRILQDIAKICKKIVLSGKVWDYYVQKRANGCCRWQYSFAT